MAARCVIVTVEEQVEELQAGMNAIVLPAFLVSAVAVVPGGAYPSYAQGYYSRDNSFYMAWDDIARERQPFHELDGTVRACRRAITLRICAP